MRPGRCWSIAASWSAPWRSRALAAGYPVIIGISVYASFEGPDVTRTGVVPMPVTSGAAAEDMLGGHCMLC